MRLNQHNASPKLEVLKQRNPPEIRFSRKALLKQEEYVAQSPDEVGWMGFAEKVSDTLYEVNDVFLLHQVVTGATTKLDPEALFKLDDELPPAMRGKIGYWGHSHVNMAPGASGTDDTTMETLSLGRDWFIRGILNKKGEMKCSLYDYENGIAFVDTPWLMPEDKQRTKVAEIVAAELSEKVRKSVVTVSYNKAAVEAAKKHSASSGNVLSVKDQRSPPPDDKDDVKYPKDSVSWVHDVEKGELVKCSTENHVLHLLSKWRKNNEPQPKMVDLMAPPEETTMTPAQIADAWFKQMEDRDIDPEDPYYFNGGY